MGLVATAMVEPWAGGLWQGAVLASLGFGLEGLPCCASCALRVGATEEQGARPLCCFRDWIRCFVYPSAQLRA